MVTKVAGGIIGLGLISAGGIAMAKPHWLGIDYMPKWHSLSEDNGFSTETYSTGKFGEKYKNYLVGSIHKNNVTNQAWWEWSFRRLSRETTENGKFKQVAHGYGTNKDTDLSKVCEEAYKLPDDTASFGNDGTKYNKSDVWKYCSPGLLTHTNQDEDKYGPKTIGGTTDNASKLVSVKDSSNDWFWEIRNKDFWSKDTNNNWSGQKATGTKATSIFKKEHEENSSNVEGSNRQTIKDLCKEAYNKEKSSDGNDKNNDDALKFCMLETA